MTDLFGWKGAFTDWAAEKVKAGISELAVQYIEALPIMLGVSIGVYALVSMVNKSLAKMSVVGVFIYGGYVVIA